MGLVEAQGLDASCVPRIATPFGAGIARHGEICGALVGASMALGLMYGREDAADRETRDALYVKVDTLLRAFEHEYGSVRCIDLTGCDMTTPEGHERSRELDLHGSVCPKFVALAVEQAARLMDK